MRVAPPLHPPHHKSTVRRRSALLINPFYPKDPHASFGKHVLTPTLALTTVAAATPASWDVSYWDENLLQGPPPSDPLPQVVGLLGACLVPFSQALQKSGGNCLGCINRLKLHVL